MAGAGVPLAAFCVLLLSVFAEEARCDESTAEVVCADGSRIKGSLLAIGSDRVEFTSPNLFKPAPLRLDQIVEIHLPGKHEDPEGDHIASVTLSNGDVLKGSLSRVDDEFIGLRTWYAGDLLFRRSMVDSLDIQDRPQRIYAGPTGLEGWRTDTKESWTFESGAFRSRSSGEISREFDLPQKSRFAFDVAWRSNPRFRVVFYSDDISANVPNNCYALVCQNRYVYLRKYWRKGPGDGSNIIGNAANVPELLNKEKARFEVQIDRQSGAIRFIVNGRVAADWSDPEPAVGELGGGVHFVAEDTSPLRVSRIEITSWDGLMEPVAPMDEGDPMEADDETSPVQQDEVASTTRIRLRNNDYVAGIVRGIDDGFVNLETSFGEVRIPVSRLRTFSLHTKEEREDYKLGRYEIPRLYRGDVRAWFADGGIVTFRLENSADGRLEGYSQTFGNARFDASAFNRIEFNIYEEDFQVYRSQGRW